MPMHSQENDVEAKATQSTEQQLNSNQSQAIQNEVNSHNVVDDSQEVLMANMPISKQGQQAVEDSKTSKTTFDREGE